MAKKLDEQTIEAVRVLTDAVRFERVPGLVEFNVLEGALAAVINEPTQESLTAAAAMFKTIEPSLQERVARRAKSMAQSVVAERRALAIAAPSLRQTAPDEKADVRAASAPKQSATPFLSVLNGGTRRRSDGLDGSGPKR